jgi:hypothetical protein
MDYSSYYYPVFPSSSPGFEPYMGLYGFQILMNPYNYVNPYNLVNPYNSVNHYTMTSAYTPYLIASAAAAMYSSNIPIALNR